MYPEGSGKGENMIYKVTKSYIKQLVKEALQEAKTLEQKIKDLYDLYRFGDIEKKSMAIMLAEGALGLDHESLIKEFIKYIGDDQEVGQFGYEVGYALTEAYEESGKVKDLRLQPHHFSATSSSFERGYEDGQEEYYTDAYASSPNVHQGEWDDE